MYANILARLSISGRSSGPNVYASQFGKRIKRGPGNAVVIFFVKHIQHRFTRAVFLLRPCLQSKTIIYYFDFKIFGHSQGLRNHRLAWVIHLLAMGCFQ